MNTATGTPSQQKQHPLTGSIVVVAKYPAPGKSKTRLEPLLGAAGSALLAKAMLSDVLSTLSNSLDDENIRKVLLYAPPTQEGLHQMRQILDEITSDQQQHSSASVPHWDLLPILSTTTATATWSSNSGDSASTCPSSSNNSNLGPILTDALMRTRHFQASSLPGPIIFLGMDAPEVPLDEIHSALSHPDSALLCPTPDGGYGLLSIPPSARQQQQVGKNNEDKDADATIFNHVGYWSHSLTAMAQCKALTDAGIALRIGRLMHDIDEPADVQALVQRLCSMTEQNNNSNNKTEKYLSCLSQASVSGVEPCLGKCHYTRLALTQLGLMSPE